MALSSSARGVRERDAPATAGETPRSILKRSRAAASLILRAA
jgi:hypothetical protein